MCRVGSSSASRTSPVPIFSSSPRDLGVTATEKTGGGSSSAGKGLTPLSPKVSPVRVCWSLATPPMSPAQTSGVLTCSLPRGKKSVATRSSPARALWTWLSDLTQPPRTLK